eukprot:11177054-Lingulodinium_polyedra.AAC.1
MDEEVGHSPPAAPTAVSSSLAPVRPCTAPGPGSGQGPAACASATPPVRATSRQSGGPVAPTTKRAQAPV